MKNINLDKRKILLLIIIALLCSCDNNLKNDMKKVKDEPKKEFPRYLDSPIKIRQDSNIIKPLPKVLLSYNKRNKSR